MRFLIVSLSLLVLLSTDLFAQSRDVVNRINRLENELQTLNDAVFRGKKPPISAYSGSQLRGGSGQGITSSQAAQIEVRLSQLEQQIRDLTGRIEETAFISRRLESDLQRALQDMELRFKNLEGKESNSFRSGQNTYQVTTPQVQQAPSQILKAPSNITAPSQSQSGTLGTLRDAAKIPANDPISEYEAAFALLRSGDYGKAEAGFRNFLKDHEKHNLASNAQYWLAETYYVRGNYEQAARGFAIGFQNYPSSSKAPDNLLKLGLSLANSGKKQEACLTFQKLDTTFPNPPTPLKRRVAQEKSRLGCS